MIILHIPVKPLTLDTPNGKITANVLRDGLWRAEKPGETDRFPQAEYSPFVNLIREALSLIQFDDVGVGEDVALVLEVQAPSNPGTDDNTPSLTHDVTLTS